MTQKLPLPLTAAMLAKANAAHEGKPRYNSSANVAADWHGGAGGNDVDHAEAMQAVANSHSANVEIDYDPQHQEDKGKNMNPVLTPLSDLGKDYGVNGSGTYRNGTIQPRQPYPTAAFADEPLAMASPAGIAPIVTGRYPLALPSTLRANQYEALPRYYGPGVAGDWVGGSVGNDVNAATATTPVVTSASAATLPNYSPRTQTDRGQGMTPNLTVIDDIGKDYGTYGGLAGRTGTIQPRQPYPATGGGGGGGSTSWPDATNTGVPVGTTLTASPGAFTTTSAGQVIDALDITGQVTIAHNNCTLKRSRIRNAGFAVVSVTDGVTGTSIQDCEIDGLTGSGTRGISGSGSILRCNIHHIEDGIYIRGSNTTVQDCYIHNLASSYSDPHYDCIANDGGFSNIIYRHNTMINDYGQTSNCMTDNQFGSVDNVWIDGNKLIGAGYNIYADGQLSGVNFITKFKATNNLLGVGASGPYAITSVAPAEVTISGNYTTRGYYLDGDVPPVAGTVAFAPTTVVTAASDRNDNTGFRVAVTLASAILTEFRLVFYSGSAFGMGLTAVAFGKQSSGQVSTAPLVAVPFGGSTAALLTAAVQRYVTSDWISPGALTFPAGSVMLVGFNLTNPGGTCAPAANTNATSFFGPTGSMTVASPGYTAIPNACYGVARIETR